MKYLLILFISLTVYGNDYVLTPGNKSSSGCNLTNHFDSPPTKSEFKIQYENLKEHFDNANWSKISKQMVFPFLLHDNSYNKKTKKWTKRKMNFENAKEFIAKAPKIFSNNLKMDSFEKEKFFCNYQGIMIKNGSLWMTFNDNKKIIIKAMNYGKF